VVVGVPGGSVVRRTAAGYREREYRCDDHGCASGNHGRTLVAPVVRRLRSVGYMSLRSSSSSTRREIRMGAHHRRLGLGSQCPHYPSRLRHFHMPRSPVDEPGSGVVAVLIVGHGVSACGLTGRNGRPGHGRWENHLSSARRMGPPDCHDLGATWLRGEHAGGSDWCQRGRPWECRQARVRQAGEQCRAGRPVPVGVKARLQVAQLVSLRGFVTPRLARWAACRQAGPQ
jgi:hypothetical protein